MFSGEVVEEGGVGGDEAAVAHLHEEMEEGHVDAAEEAVDLSMSCFVEIAVVPETDTVISYNYYQEEEE